MILSLVLCPFHIKVMCKFKKKIKVFKCRSKVAARSRSRAQNL